MDTKHRQQPRELTEPTHQDRARRIRDRHWETLELIAQHDPLYICWWNKDRYHDRTGTPLPEDLLVHGLIDGLELAAWLRKHPDWTDMGEWSDERHAVPVWITGAGRKALANRHLYDMEPVEGGLVEPGWTAVPTPPELTQDIAPVPAHVHPDTLDETPPCQLHSLSLIHI